MTIYSACIILTLPVKRDLVTIVKVLVALRIQ